MIKVREVEARPEYKLFLRFSDGTRGVADLRALIEQKPFSALRKEAVFREAYVDRGAVEWPAGVGVAAEALYAMAHGMKVPKTLDEAKDNELAMSLTELRKLAGVTQTDAGNAIDMDQGQLSRFERSEDRKLSTLRRYVEALGGRLEVTAVIGDKRVILRGV